MSVATRTSAAILAVACGALLAAGCGGSRGSRVAQLGSGVTVADITRTSPSDTTSSPSVQRKQALAFSRCMRSHGVRDFPAPDGRGNYPPLTQQALGVSKQTSLAAQNVCLHLLAGGGRATPQQVQQKLAFGVRVARCLRKHGYPDFPDPSRLGPQELPQGIDASAPRFQAAEAACESRARKALGLP